MRLLDFMSGAPKMSIFREKANKTTLGGALYLIYLIILITLFAIYIINFISQKKYVFNYSLVKQSIERIMELDNNKEKREKFDANLDYKFYLGKDYGNIKDYNITDNKDFFIIDVNALNQKIESDPPRDEDGFFKLNSDSNQNEDECIIRQGKKINQKASELILAVLYRCEKDNCTIRENDKIKIYSYYLFFEYKGFSIEHQNPEKPIQPLSDDIFWLEYILFFNNTNLAILKWELIQYEEEKGVFGKTYNDMVGNNYTYRAGYYKNIETYTDDGHGAEIPNTLWKIKDLNGNHFKLLLYLESHLNYLDYEKYTRKKISFLDTLASVAALGSTVLGLMSSVYAVLYSENYDKFKIIENILTKKMKINIHNNDFKKEDKTKEEKMMELKTDLIITENENNNLNIKESDEENEEDDFTKSYKESANLPSPRFLDFLIHNFYFKCCKPSIKQALISSCNDIVSKYITIENIIYNQIKLEYLWKDYKWNNPQYEKQQKDDLIKNLKAS